VLFPINHADCPKHQISFHFIRICHFGHTYSLQLEKLEKLSKFATYIIYKSPTTAELITRSIYTGNWIIDESKTVTLPNIFIRTSDSYFHEKLLHINAMIEHYSNIIISYAEGKWTRRNFKIHWQWRYSTINRPLHTTLYFVN